MSVLFKGGTVVTTTGRTKADVFVEKGKIKAIGAGLGKKADEVLDCKGKYILPGAIDPHTENFRQFPQYVRTHLDPARHKKVAMFCTGGIRCEKASAFMLKEGFEEVYHLQGGILKYLEEV